MSDASRQSAAHILIAEDDELLVQLLRYKLSRVGFQVEAVGDGDDALKAVRASRPDLIVLDGMMPGRDGFDVLRELKQDPRTADIPIIMLSARKLEADVVGGLQLGADEYITKPFMPDELIARIKRLLAVKMR